MVAGDLDSSCEVVIGGGTLWFRVMVELDRFVNIIFYGVEFIFGIWGVLFNFFVFIYLV